MNDCDLPYWYIVPAAAECFLIRVRMCTHWRRYTNPGLKWVKRMNDPIYDHIAQDSDKFWEGWEYSLPLEKTPDEFGKSGRVAPGVPWGS